MMPPAGLHVEIPGYRVTGRLGEGGMGAVLLAEREEDGLDVAIKIAPAEGAGRQEFLRRLRREMDIAKGFGHPYLVKILDGGVLPGSKGLYLVMERLKGLDLHKTVMDELLAPGKALQVATHMAEALSYLHARKLVHRDIKPANIFLEDSGRTVLLDFGLALDPDKTRLTATGAIVGTLHFMAPEQLAGDEPGHLSDIYSLGCALYWALTGSTPYDQDELTRLAMGHELPPPPSVNDLSPSVPEDFSQIIDRCIAVEPYKRVRSADALGRELADVAAGSSTRRHRRPSRADTVGRQGGVSKTGPSISGRSSGSAARTWRRSPPSSQVATVVGGPRQASSGASVSSGTAPPLRTAAVVLASLACLAALVIYLMNAADAGRHRAGRGDGSGRLPMLKRRLQQTVAELARAGNIPDEKSCARLARLYLSIRQETTGTGKTVHRGSSETVATNRGATGSGEASTFSPGAGHGPYTSGPKAGKGSEAMLDRLPPVTSNFPEGALGLLLLAQRLYHAGKNESAFRCYLALGERYGLYCTGDFSTAVRLAQTATNSGSTDRLMKLARSLGDRPEDRFARAYLTIHSGQSAERSDIDRALKEVRTLFDHKPAVIDWNVFSTVYLGLLNLKDTNESRDEAIRFIEDFVLKRAEISARVDHLDMYFYAGLLLDGYHDDLSIPILDRHTRKAIEYMKRALELARRNGDEDKVFTLTMGLAGACFRNGDRKSGLRFLKTLEGRRLPRKQQFEYHRSYARILQDDLRFDEAQRHLSIAASLAVTRLEKKRIKEQRDSLLALKLLSGRGIPDGMPK